jgi:GTPase SAR1 family protein
MGFLVVYDTTDRASFDNLGQWLQEIKRHAHQDCPVVLVGTKADLTSQRAVPVAEVCAFAEQHCGWANSFVETSSKTNEGVDHAFQLLAEQINRKQDDHSAAPLSPAPSGMPRAGSVAFTACCNLQ